MKDKRRISHKSAKARGRNLQNKVAAEIRETFPYILEADDVKPAIMGESGMDIKLSPLARRAFPYAIECKNTERLDVWGSLKQAEENAVENLTPLLVFKRNRSKIYACIEFTELLRLISRKDDEKKKA